MTGVNASSPAKRWLRALELTEPIARNRQRVLPAVMEELAGQFGDAPALLSDSECLSYRALWERSNRYARWALAQGLGKGETVGLLMSNRPEYLAIWLGITSVGCVVALLNTNLTGDSLAHCIDVAQPKHLIVAPDLMGSLAGVLPQLTAQTTIWTQAELESPLEQYSGGALRDGERRQPAVDDPALFIYTSGTTGLPKAAVVSHGRLMQWAYWFAGMMDTRSTDRMYNCLPLYHSVGGVQAVFAVLVNGGSVVLRDKFSGSRFWSEIARWECTLFQYIGELCRYLLHYEPSAHESEHHLRMACGNGLGRDIWSDFQNRFRIPRIFEFYGATEGNVSFFNPEGEPGSIGRVPQYLSHRFPAMLVKSDVDTGEPVRNSQGFCIPCAPDEAGEAIGRIPKDSPNVASQFHGYTDRAASEAKILRGVFEPDDAWFRTGDLMRKDERGFFYFVDRIGDTFRWKGENVSAMEVAEAIRAFPGIQEAAVYGVAIPGADGRAGMATVVAAAGIDLAGFREHMLSRLPEFARPVFLRLRNCLEVTATYKYTKSTLVREGYDPDATMDPIYFHHAERQAFVRMDRALYERILEGGLGRMRNGRAKEGVTAHV